MVEVEGKHELFPGVFANPEQDLAIDKIQSFLNSRTAKEQYFTLIGKAGTGKTTVLRKALEAARGVVIVGAMTHKAKEIVQRSINNSKYGYYSLASMLGMQLDIETGKFTADYSNKNTPPIATANVIVIDECSMINEEALKLILDKKLPNAKLIFVGDSNQLAPIREEGDEHEGETSPVFKSDQQTNLIQRMRQGEDSSILPYADYYWYNASVKESVLDPIPNRMRKNTKDVKFVDTEGFLAKPIKAFHEVIKTRNSDVIRLVCFRNTTRTLCNQLIRDELFINPACFEKNDLLILFDSYRVKSFRSGEVIKLENSQELFVDKVERQARVVDEKAFNIYLLHVSFNHRGLKHTSTIEVLDPTERNDFNSYVSELFGIANDIPKVKGVERKQAYMKAYAVKNRFAKVDYGYAITVHKAQGSSYDKVIVYESDIMNISMNTNKEKSQAMYVAITRAKDKCFILN